jgi:hypothetical protein
MQTMQPLITIFSAPKPFSDPHIATIQRNAIQSWLHLGETVDVLLIGEEPGLEQVVNDYSLNYIRAVDRNESGTPLVSSLFSIAREWAQSPYMAYVNADILLLPNFVQAAKRVGDLVTDFLLIGQRWDLQVDHLLDFSDGWEQRLKTNVSQNGNLHLPAGSDYFIYPRHLFKEIPDFAIGRAGWDNWMIYHAKHQDWMVVDGTPSMTVIHQNHDYSHLPGGRPHYEQEESFVNEDLAGGQGNLYMVLDCDRQIQDGQLLRPQISLVRSLRWAERWAAPKNGTDSRIRNYLSRRFRRLRRRLTGSL